MSEQISYRSEIARKGIHLLSLLIPIIYLQIEADTGVAILASMTLVSIVIDVLMHYHAPTRSFMHAVVGPMLRPHELASEVFRLTGASWVLIAATLTFLMFPKVVSTTAFTVLIVSDTAAALIGRRFGNKPFFDKTRMGTTFFIVSAVFVTLVYQQVFGESIWFVVSGVVASIVCGIVEAASTRLRLDDNISIPFSFAFVMLLMNWLGQAIFATTNFLRQ